jgi:hypothetical protein
MDNRVLFKILGREGKAVGCIMVAGALLLMFGPNGLRPPGMWISSARMLTVAPLRAGALLLAMIAWELFCGLVAFMAFRGLVAPRRIEGTLSGFEVLEDSKTGKRKISVNLGGANIVVRYHSALEDALRGLSPGETKIAIFMGAFGYVNRLEHLID